MIWFQGLNIASVLLVSKDSLLYLSAEKYLVSLYKVMSQCDID